MAAKTDNPKGVAMDEEKFFSDEEAEQAEKQGRQGGPGRGARASQGRLPPQCGTQELNGI